MSTQTIIIGDLHGRYDLLVKMWKEIKFDKNTTKLVLLGDYVDRGKDSYEVIQFIKRKQKQFGKNKIIALRGNHEDMMINAIENPYNYSEKSLWFMNGGKVTEESFLRNGKNVNSEIKWLKSLPLYYEDEAFIAVHAGLRPNVKLENQKEEDLLWIREEFYNAPMGTFDKTIVFGHTITVHIDRNNTCYPMVIGDGIALDTGAVHTGILSALKISDENAEVIQVTI